MALQKFTCPPQGPSGASSFSDDLVGFQLVTGGGLTQGNFEFATSFNKKLIGLLIPERFRTQLV